MCIEGTAACEDGMNVMCPIFSRNEKSSHIYKALYTNHWVFTVLVEGVFFVMERSAYLLQNVLVSPGSLVAVRKLTDLILQQALRCKSKFQRLAKILRLGTNYISQKRQDNEKEAKASVSTNLCQSQTHRINSKRVSDTQSCSSLVIPCFYSVVPSP